MCNMVHLRQVPIGRVYVHRIWRSVGNVVLVVTWPDSWRLWLENAPETRYWVASAVVKLAQCPEVGVPCAYEVNVIVVVDHEYLWL